ncbi:MAG: carbamoyl phosphate synthase small subunit, partial [Clostridia bacterium]|nr:carbamoyl phosphate synthase small subunit [Clostridia bacterium]
MKKVYLFLENGMSFCGQAFGAQGDAVGELVFTTSMVGYLETLTDNNYYGQVVMQTFPLIGNYGVIGEDLKGKKPALKAYIAKEICDIPSNFRCEGDLDSYLKENGIVGICGIDTREITKILRTHGVMNCMITDRDTLTEDEMDELCGYRIKGGVEALSTKQVVTEIPENTKRRIVLWDFGECGNLVENLVSRDCAVVRVSYKLSAKE